MNKFIMKSLVLGAVMATVAAGSAMAATQTGWVQQSDGNYKYYTANGTEATDVFKQSGSDWYYLGDDGIMVTNALVEHSDNIYYVDETGKMVKNKWEYLQDTNGDDGQYWFYFGDNGKAYKRSSSATKAQTKDINNKKYIFDEYGHMLHGWITEDGTQCDEDDATAWQTAMYYAGGENDGAVVCSAWKALDVEDNDNTNYAGYYWFYFKETGKKVTNTSSYTINGKKYGFNEYGAMISEWNEVVVATGSTPSQYKYYGGPDSGIKQTGWFQAIPAESYDPEGYEDGKEVWYYAKSNGDILTSCLKTINGKKYAFDAYGKMMTGFRALSVENNEISLYSGALEEIDAIKEFDGSGMDIYYFDESGAMCKGSKTVKLDGDSYTFNFLSTGAGKNGIISGCIYVNGRRLQASTDIGYAQFDLSGEEVTSGGYLVNTSGKIQKNAKNKKDKDDMYWCTDADGIVTYHGSTKYDG